MNIVLIDTDVILDFFFDRQPFSEQASMILILCEKKIIQGFLTPVIISNVYYLLRKTATHEKVIKNLKKLMSIIDVAIINKATVLEALNADFKDFEDALQNFSAQNEKGIKVIITRNIKDYKSSKMSVMTPETYLRSIQ
ncbi:MAG: PIN domain-containing protein [Chitinophagaceae bacterium]